MRRRCLAAATCIGLATFGAVDLKVIEESAVMVRKAQAGDPGKAGPQRSVPPARDPAIAVAEEYDIARRQGTAAAFELFIARHGDDPLAEKARAELKRLSR